MVRNPPIYTIVALRGLVHVGLYHKKSDLSCYCTYSGSTQRPASFIHFTIEEKYSTLFLGEILLLISAVQRLEAIPSKNLAIKDGLWGERQNSNSNRTIPAICRQLKTSARAGRRDWQPGPHFFDANARSAWFKCACCPPTFARLAASSYFFFYSVSTATSTCTTGTALFSKWGGAAVRIEQDTEGCLDFCVILNGSPFFVNLNRAVIACKWAGEDEVVLSLALPVEHSAIQCGPVVSFFYGYCLDGSCMEEVDNGHHLANIALPRGTHLNSELDAACSVE
jgi:hypothetical protein